MEYQYQPRQRSGDRPDQVVSILAPRIDSAKDVVIFRTK